MRDYHGHPVAVGEFLSDAIRGLELRQHRLTNTATRILLQSPVAADILQWTYTEHTDMD
jgi:hypothetical protein